MRDQLGALVTGTALGYCLSRMGFSSWDEVHRMFTFAELRLLLAFGLGVVALGAAWWGLRRVATEPPRWPSRPVHRGTLWGGALFGLGWALCGACPGSSLVQLGEGQLGALCTLGGILLGNWLYSRIHERYFRWVVQSCADG